MLAKWLAQAHEIQTVRIQYGSPVTSITIVELLCICFLAKHFGLVRKLQYIPEAFGESLQNIKV